MHYTLRRLAPLGARLPTLGVLAGALVVAACGTTEPRATKPVVLQLSASSSRSGAAAGPLQFSAVRLVVTTASLGSGDQFGCVDCQGDSEGASATPKLVSLPLNGGSLVLATEQAAPGRYDQAEIAVEPAGAMTLAGATGWPAGATILVEGTYNGAAFQLPLDVVGIFRETLSPPLEVLASGAPATIAVTITLPVAKWFESNGLPLDPNNAAQRATIIANARQSFQPLESAGGDREP